VPRLGLIVRGGGDTGLPSPSLFGFGAGYGFGKEGGGYGDGFDGMCGNGENEFSQKEHNARWGTVCFTTATDDARGAVIDACLHHDAGAAR
jgi:hypothetical protein